MSESTLQPQQQSELGPFEIGGTEDDDHDENNDGPGNGTNDDNAAAATTTTPATETLSSSMDVPTPSSSATTSITAQERVWALEIKRAVEMTPDHERVFGSISDLEYVQHGIIAKDKTAKALKRLQRMHHFRQEYDIPNNSSSSNDDDTCLEASLQAVRNFVQVCAGGGFLTGFARDDETGRFVLSLEFQQLLVKDFQTPAAWKAFFVGLYYVLQATQPDIPSIRAGTAWIAECAGMSRKNFSIALEQRAAALYQNAYAVRICELSMVHAPKLLRIIYKLCSPFLSKRVKEVFHMNADLPAVRGRYPSHVLPVSLGGTLTLPQLLQTLEDSLKRRLELERSFRL